MRNTKEVAERNRQKLIAAGVKTFYEAGFSAARLVDIAERAGLTRGAIYWHFENKADLFRAILEERSIPNLEQIADLYLAKTDIFHLLSDVIDFVLEGPEDELVGSHERVQMYQTLFSETPEGLEDITFRYNEAFEMIFENHVQVLEQAQAMGSIRQDIDPYTEARTFYATVWGYYLNLKRWFEFDPHGEAIRKHFKNRLVETLKPQAAVPARLPIPKLVAAGG